MTKPAVFGLVENETQARHAVECLEIAGFLRSDISVLSLAPESDISENPGPLRTVEGDIIDARTRAVGHTNSTKAPEGATTGVAAGGAVGALAGWLIGAGLLAIPGAGAFIAAGPILAALSGAAIGGAAGGVAGALIGHGIPEYEAKIYAGHLKDGHVLIGVHAVNCEESRVAQEALSKVGAHDIKVTSEVAAE